MADAVGEPLLPPLATVAPLLGSTKALTCVVAMVGGQTLQHRFAIPVNPLADWIRARRIEWSPGGAAAGARVARLHHPSGAGAWRLRDRLQGEPQRVGPDCSDQGVPAIRTRGTRRCNSARQEHGLRDVCRRPAAALPRRWEMPVPYPGNVETRVSVALSKRHP